MTKSFVLSRLEACIDDPGSLKSGEYLREEILDEARRIQDPDREFLVDVLRDWLQLRSEPRTMVAVDIAKVLALGGLKDDIQALRDDIVAGKAFSPYYLRWIDEALSSLVA